MSRDLLSAPLCRVLLQGWHRNCKIKFQDFKDFLGPFPGLFKVFLQALKSNFDYYSFMHIVFCTWDRRKNLM